jgi:F420-dependent oxidoreductase-like protein
MVNEEVKVGLQIPNFSWPESPANIGAKLTQMAETADEVGFSSLWLMDHFFQIDVDEPRNAAEEPMLEGYSTISYLAAVTRRIKLGLLVTGNIYRHPGLLMKTVTTIDVLSGGRAYFGIGAGWYQHEAKGLGVPFPATKSEIIGRLEETLRIAKQMWAGHTNAFLGKYYHFTEPINSPQPLTRPHPPILIGCHGWKKILRLVAEYGDEFNAYLGGIPDRERLGNKTLKEYLRRSAAYQERRRDLTAKLERLKGHCMETVTPFEEIEPLRVIGRDVIPAIAKLGNSNE